MQTPLHFVGGSLVVGVGIQAYLALGTEGPVRGRAACVETLSPRRGCWMYMCRKDRGLASNLRRVLLRLCASSLVLESLFSCCRVLRVRECGLRSPSFKAHKPRPASKKKSPQLLVERLEMGPCVAAGVQFSIPL